MALQQWAALCTNKAHGNQWIVGPMAMQAADEFQEREESVNSNVSVEVLECLSKDKYLTAKGES